MKKCDRPPRKVVVGTAMYNYERTFEGLDSRLAAICEQIAEMASMAERKYPGADGLDLVVLREEAVTCHVDQSSAAARAVPLEGAVMDTVGAAARRHATYVVLSFTLEEDREQDLYYNASVLFDRRGGVAGIYRKVHPVTNLETGVFEGGVRPGKEYPVFDCDFGKLGIQICMDYAFPDGWDALGRKGAEIVAWPTETPQTIVPACHAMRNRYYIVSSTPRETAAIFEPTGMIAAQIEQPERALVHQIDLSFMVINWHAHLNNGQAFTDAFGERVGYHYSTREDRGLFWSNDPEMTIGEMARQVNVMAADERMARCAEIIDKARGGPAA
jgi:predicted amidohydrolase